MKLAIVGAGFAGLSAAWHLLQLPKTKITLFDSVEIGEGTSGMAAGLLHPFAGLHSKKNWRGDEGMEAALMLLDIASRALGYPVYRQTGLLRVALNQTALENYRAAANLYSEIKWIENCQTVLSTLPTHPGIFIDSACKVFGNLYLLGLFKACSELGLNFKKQKIDPSTLLKEYDFVISAMGGETPFLNAIKGQLLHIAWPEGIPPLPFSISSQVYIAMDWKKQNCVVGGTYERAFSDPYPSEKAIEELWPQAIALFPPLSKGKIIDVKAGLRSTTPDHRPFLKEIEPRMFVLAGMGSKGLLYSALYGKDLSLSIAKRF